MTVLLVLLGLIFIMIILRLAVTRPIRIEMFEDMATITQGIDPTIAQQYATFSKFFNEFQTNWQKAVVSSIASDTPQQPLISPSQVSSGSTPSQPSITEMNTYITVLKSREERDFPPVSQPLPDKLTPENINTIISQIPSDTKPYRSALEWMNMKLVKAHDDMDKALRGEPITEGFQEACNDIANCIKNNPELIAKIGQASANASAKASQEQQMALLQRIQRFTGDSALIQQAAINKQLVQKSQEIQRQAESGEIVNQINVPGGNSEIKYTMPPGSDKFELLSKSDPERYNEIKTSFSGLASLKQMLDQINSNL